MRPNLRAVIAAMFCASCAYGATTPRSVSTSRQFIVYGPDAQLRGAICDVAERMKQSALSLLQERDAWKTPIVINGALPAADFPEMPPARLDVSQTGFGLKLQLQLRIDADVNARTVERELLRAIYLEMMYRARPELPAGTPYVEPPDWLLEGTLALADENETAAIAQTLGTIVSTNAIVPVEDFLRQRPALLEESASRAVYRAYSAALLTLLTEMPDGRQRLARFVGHLADSNSNDPITNLRAHFPALGQDAASMQRNWTSSITRVATRGSSRLLDCEESERQLVAALRIELRDPNGRATTYSLEEFPQFVTNSKAPRALLALRQQLVLLTARANPLYRPLLEDYQKIALQLSRKKTHRIVERLAELRGMREHIRRRMSAISDYMNWFEATQSRSTSGAFAEYMKAAERAAEQQPHRRDAISVYLDAIESQFEQ